MFNKFFGKKPQDPPESRLPEERLRAMEGSASADLAAEYLLPPPARSCSSPMRTRAVVVTYMKPHKIAEGVTFIKEGDTEDTDFMLLVLDGEVMIESIVVSRTEPITVTVLGPGSLIGEMGLLDGEPRSASCTASEHGALRHPDARRAEPAAQRRTRVPLPS
jgi:CRP/FNR family cyclic AMP-dependent transcriptional regulator